MERILDTYFSNGQFVFPTNKNTRFISNTALGFLGCSTFSIWFCILIVRNSYFRSVEFIFLVAVLLILAIVFADQFLFSVIGKKILIIGRDGICVEEKGRVFKNKLLIKNFELDYIKAELSSSKLLEYWKGYELARLKVSYLGVTYYLTDCKPLYEIDLLAFKINEMLNEYKY
jgi:hypothetical protein